MLRCEVMKDMIKTFGHKTNKGIAAEREKSIIEREVVGDLWDLPFALDMASVMRQAKVCL